MLGVSLLKVSYTRWIRPDTSRDPAVTLEPDHLALTTLADHMSGHDPVWDWVFDNVGADAELPPPAPDLSLSPRVVRTEPAHAAVGVDPGTDLLVIEFSESMRPEGMSLVGGGRSFPELTGDPKWSWATPTRLEIPVALQPGVTYRIGVNSNRYDSLRAVDGTPSVPFPWVFSTAE